MAQPSPLQMLIELAQDELDAAAQRLGRAQRERNEIEVQLEALIQYRNEYYTRFTTSAQLGMAAGNMRNFQAFIDTLDGAIEQQRRLLSNATARVDAAKPEWQKHKQKLGSYEVLQARGEAVEARKTARREQKDADEFGSRQLRMRTGNV
jgi:flagellar FliJ protein